MWILVLIQHYSDNNVVTSGLVAAGWVGVIIGLEIIYKIYRRHNAIK